LVMDQSGLHYHFSGDPLCLAVLFKDIDDALALGILLYGVLGDYDGVFTGIVVQFKDGYLVWLDQPSFIGNGNLYLKTPVARVDGIAHAVYLSLEFLPYGSDLYFHFSAFIYAAKVVLGHIGFHVHLAEVDDAEEFHLPR